MTLTAENQAAIPVHKWQGIASSIIGVTSVMITLLLIGIVMSGTEPPRPVITVLQVLSSGMLWADLIGIALGFLGAKDRASRKLYPPCPERRRPDDLLGAGPRRTMDGGFLTSYGHCDRLVHGDRIEVAHRPVLRKIAGDIVTRDIRHWHR
jgi:hypothetical protein